MLRVRKAVVQPAPLKSINFSREKTHELPGDQNISSTLKRYGTKNQFAGKFPLRYEQV